MKFCHYQLENVLLLERREGLVNSRVLSVRRVFCVGDKVEVLLRLDTLFVAVVTRYYDNESPHCQYHLSRVCRGGSSFP